MELRSYGVSPGQPWGAPIAAYGAPGLRRPSPFGPPLPWEGRRDSAGRLVVFTAFEGFVVGGLLIALSLVRTPVLTELIGGCPHEELLGRTCSPMRGEGYRGLGILGGAGGPGRYRENRLLIVIDCDDFPRMMAFWKEALHYVPKYSPDGGWVILKDPEGRGPNLSLNLPSRRSPGLVSASPGSLCRGPEGRGQASPPPRCDSSSVRATRGGLRRPRGPGRQPVLRRPSVMQLNRPIGSLNRSKGYGPLEHGD